MNRKHSIVFFGTDEFAVAVLRELAKADFEIVAVVTPPDEPAGRKKILRPSPVKIAAQEMSLPLYQPARLKEFEMPVCDLGVVVVYGKIIPRKLIDSAKFGFLNIHPSLLPKYRGPSPIKTAIFNGDTETGVTIIQLDSEMDHGPIVGNIQYQISNIKMHEEIRDELAKLGAELLIKVIPDYISGKITPKPQDHSKATHTKMLTREDGKIDWHRTPLEIYNQFRAYHDWPGIWFEHNGKRVKILECSLENATLKLSRLQPEGGNPMSMQDFLNGYGSIKYT